MFRLLGRVRAATISLKGRLAEAHPPGATMAVRENKLSCEGSEVKAQAHINQHFLKFRERGPSVAARYAALLHPRRFERVEHRHRGSGENSNAGKAGPHSEYMYRLQPRLFLTKPKS